MSTQDMYIRFVTNTLKINSSDLVDGFSFKNNILHYEASPNQHVRIAYIADSGNFILMHKLASLVGLNQEIPIDLLQIMLDIHTTAETEDIPVIEVLCPFAPASSEMAWHHKKNLKSLYHTRNNMLQSYNMFPIDSAKQKINYLKTIQHYIRLYENEFDVTY